MSIHSASKWLVAVVVAYPLRGATVHVVDKGQPLYAYAK